jgi:hypothetical protein
MAIASPRADNLIGAMANDYAPLTHRSSDNFRFSGVFVGHGAVSRMGRWDCSNEWLAARVGRATQGAVMSRITAIAAVVALPLFASGCGEGTRTVGSAGPAPTASGGGGGAIAASATGSASSAPSSSPLSGAWRGSFESKKAPVSLDPGVKEKTWSADDGKAHAGKGEIDLHVGVDGVVKGKLRGALGNATVAGTAEGDALTMTFAPAESDGGEWFSGVIVLQLKDAKLSGDLKASSGDATIVRAATLELTRGDH